MSDNKTNLELARECGAYAVPTAIQTEPGAAVPMAILFSSCQLDAFADRVLDDFTAKLAATPALPGPVFEQVAPNIEVGYDMFGGVDIRLGGDFVYVHINYDYRYTHNSARRALADNIVELLGGRSATTAGEIARLQALLDTANMTMAGQAAELESIGAGGVSALLPGHGTTPTPMTEDAINNVIGNWFAEDWAIKNARGMLRDLGIGKA